MESFSGTPGTWRNHYHRRKSKPTTGGVRGPGGAAWPETGVVVADLSGLYVCG